MSSKKCGGGGFGGSSSLGPDKKVDYYWNFSFLLPPHKGLLFLFSACFHSLNHLTELSWTQSTVATMLPVVSRDLCTGSWFLWLFYHLAWDCNMSGQSRNSKTTREWPAHPRQASGKEALTEGLQHIHPEAQGIEPKVSRFAKVAPGFLPLRSEVWGYFSIQWMAVIPQGFVTLQTSLEQALRHI